MKKYENILSCEIESKIKEGKLVYVYDKGTHINYMAKDIPLSMYIDMKEDEDDRYVVWERNIEKEAEKEKELKEREQA